MQQQRRETRQVELLRDDVAQLEQLEPEAVLAGLRVAVEEAQADERRE
jgi:hypothetical protein